MDTAREIEVKLAAPEGFAVPHLAELPGVDRAAVRQLRLRATYWDTDDGRLARSGLTLRHRTGEGRPRWTLKTPSTSLGSLDRTELTVVGTGTAVPAVLADLLTARLRGAPLSPLAVVRTARTTTVLYDAEGAELVEVVDDEVTVLRDRVVVDGWRELEVEQRPGGTKVGRRVLKALYDGGAGETDQVPKGVRAVGAAGGPDLPEPGGDVVATALRKGLRDLVDRDLMVRTGAEDGVHQLRVTCRRLRSDLRTYRALVDDPRVAVLRDELRWLGGELSAARDLEVLRGRVAAQDLDTAPLDAVLSGLQRDAEEQALTALRSSRYLVLLQLLHDLAVSPPATSPTSVSVLQGKARKRLGSALRELRLDGDDASWHEARKLAKRARYAAEAVGAGKDAKRAKRLQALLGEHQDAVAAAERLMSVAAEHPSLAVLCGRLIDRELRRARELRRSLL